MNIIGKIQTINNGVIQLKENFKTALQNKNVTVSDLLKLKDYPNLINEIKGSVTENIDLTNLTPENIRAGVTINGVTGTLVEQWDVVISPNRPENPRNGTIWIRDLSDESNNESGDDSGGGDSGGNNTGGGDTGGESSLTSVEVYAQYLENKQIDGCYFNGTYTIKDPAQTGQSAVYVNEANGTELYYSYYWSLRPIGASSRPILLYNYDAINPWEFTSNNWYDDTNLYSFTGTITLVTDEGGSGGDDTPSVTYLYTVSGSSNASANGDYYDTGETFNGAKTYTNGSCYIFFDSGHGLWYLSVHKNNTMNAPIHTCSSNDNTQVPTSGWSGGVTVSVYGGGSGGGTSTADYIISGASNSLADGEYYLTTETYDGYPVYKNANDYVIYMTSSYGWCIASAVGQAPTHGAQGNFDPVPPTTGWYGSVTVTKG